MTTDRRAKRPRDGSIEDDTVSKRHLAEKNEIKIPGSKLFEEGLQYFRLERDKEALSLFEKAAARHYPAAHLFLAMMYMYGIGVEQDPKKAFFHEAECIKNHSWFENRESNQPALRLYCLGLMHMHGIGVDKNLTTAFKYIQDAAAGKNMDAMLQLGKSYQRGEGVNVDLIEARECFEKAEQMGHPAASLQLGLCYENGRGAEQSIEMAISCFIRSVEQGHSAAYFNLANCYLYHPGHVSKSEAVRILSKSVEQGNPEAEGLLGWCYLKGQGVTKDLREALRLLNLAAEKEVDFAQNLLGNFYTYHLGEAIGIDNDPELAAHWYKRSADNGYVQSMVQIASIYQTGLGLTQDREKAISYYMLAAQKRKYAPSNFYDFAREKLSELSQQYPQYFQDPRSTVTFFNPPQPLPPGGSIEAIQSESDLEPEPELGQKLESKPVRKR